MASNAPIPRVEAGLFSWFRKKPDAVDDAIERINQLCALQISFGGKLFPLRFMGENALIDLKETIVAATSALPKIAPFTVLANPTSEAAAPIATGSPILNSTTAVAFGGGTYQKLITFQANGGNSYSLLGSQSSAGDGLRLSTPNTAFYIDVGTRLADALLFGSGDSNTGNNTFFSISRTAATGGKVQLDAINSGADGVDFLINTRFTAGNVLIGTTDTTGLSGWGGLKTRSVLIALGGLENTAIGAATPSTGAFSGVRIAASGYENFGATIGATGYGFRDNGGTMQVKNSAGSWADIGSGGGSGDVVGPSSATDNEVVRFDGTTGKLIKATGAFTATVSGTGSQYQGGFYNATNAAGNTAGFKLSNTGAGWEIRFRTNPSNGWFEIADNSDAIQHRWQAKDYLLASDGVFGWSSQTNFATAGVGARDTSIARNSSYGIDVTRSGSGSVYQAGFINTTNAAGNTAGFRLLNSGAGWEIRFRTNPSNGWFEIADNTDAIQHRWQAKDYLFASSGKLYWSSETNFATAGVGAGDTVLYRSASAVLKTDGSLNVGVGLGIRDTSAAFDITLAATSSTTLTAGRTLTLDLVNAARTLKLTGNPTLADWFDQSVKTTASPTFALSLFTGVVQFQGTGAPLSTGAGIEIRGGATTSSITGYDRTNSAYVPITIDGLSYTFAVSGLGVAAVSSTGIGITGVISTSAPAGASAGNWKLGSLVTGLTLSLNLTQAVYVDIGGTVYKLLTGS